MEYDITPEPQSTIKPIPPLAKQLMGIASEECSVAIDENGLIAEDALCRQCSYNIRGMDIQSRCPECGISIGWSTHGDLLRYSDPEWVKQLSSGSLLMVISILFGIFATIIASVLFGESGGTVAQLISSGIGVIGYWKITMPDPGYPETNPIWNLRQMTRILAVFAFLGVSLQLSIALTLDYSSVVELSSAALAIICSLMSIIASLLLFILMRRIALRIPDESIANQTKVVMWGLIGSYAVMLVGGILALIAALAGSGGAIGIGVFGLFGCAGMIGLLVFGIWWIVLLFRYRSALNKATEIAMQTWMRHAAQSYSNS